MYTNNDAMENMDFLMNEDLMSPQRTTATNKASSNWMSPFGQLASAIPSPPGTNMSLGIDADFSPDESMKKMTANINAAVSDMNKNKEDSNFSPSLFSPPQRKGKSRKQAKIPKFPDIDSANDTTMMSEFENGRDESSSDGLNTTVGIFGDNTSSSSEVGTTRTAKVYSPTVQNIRASLIKSVFKNDDAAVSIHEQGNVNNDTILLNTSSSSSSSSPVAHLLDTSVSENRVKCNCKKSKCLKLYCQCFAVMSYCEPSLCNCVECNNLMQFEHIRAEAIKETKERNRTAFVVKVSDKKSHANGCTCKKSQCLKKYCECFEAYAHCGDNCKCVSCENYLGSVKLETMNNSREKKSSQQNQGILFPVQQNASAHAALQQDSKSTSINTSFESMSSGTSASAMLPTTRQLQKQQGETNYGNLALISTSMGKGAATAAQQYPGLPSLGTKPASMDPTMTISALADSFSLSNKRRIMYVEGEDILTRHIPVLRVGSATSSNSSSSLNSSLNTSVNTTTLVIAKNEDVTALSPIEKQTPSIDYGASGRVAVAVPGSGSSNKRLAISPYASRAPGSTGNSTRSGNTSACTSLNMSPQFSIPSLLSLQSKNTRCFDFAPQPIIVYPFFGPDQKIKLPKVIALCIIDFLSDKDLCNLSLVNKLWYSTSFDEALWE